MKQLGYIQLYSLAFFSIILSAAAIAPSDSEDCKPGVAFTDITRNDITISWNKTCFSNASSYEVELIVPGQDNCTSDTIQCNEEKLCQTSIQEMSCTGYVKPCFYVTLNVIGNNVEIPISTYLAPWFKSADWKLNETYIEEVNLEARWGPPAPTNAEYVSCATKAAVSVTCSGQQEDIIELVDLLDPTKQGNATLNIGECKDDVTLTVTYMAGAIPTGTTSSILRAYKEDTTVINCYECDGSENCGDTFIEPAEELESKARYKSCGKKHVSGGIVRYGSGVTKKAGECTPGPCFCNEDLCNGASTIATTTTLLTLVVFFLQQLI